MSEELVIIGGGLAGSEAAWQAAQRGLRVSLHEMRPKVQSGAHQTDYLAELVCSNSLGSRLPDRASGVLMEELRRLGSLLLSVAEEEALPAGGALAVDRVSFARRVTEALQSHSRIRVVREEAESIPEGLVVIASGPLTSPRLMRALSQLTGEDHLYFFDALAPIVEASSIDRSIAFRGSRYGRGDLPEGDYVNCPLTKTEYDRFVGELLSAKRIPLRAFEEAVGSGVRAGMDKFFEGCLPVEILAGRGHEALAFGPMRPVGLVDPRTGRRPFAAVQLRQDDVSGDLFNLVGFQTNLTYDEQRRVFRMIPGLERAKFARLGQMHRNTFINSPSLLQPSLQFRRRPDLFFAGQITGVEGYLGNVGTGLLAGVNASLLSQGREPLVLPRTTMLGALCHYVTHAGAKVFQPMKANFGIMPPLLDGERRNRRQRAQAYADRASRTLAQAIEEAGVLRIATSGEAGGSLQGRTHEVM